MNHLFELPRLRRIAAGVSLACLFGTAGLAQASVADHHEFEATLHVPFKGDANLRAGANARYFTLEFDYQHLKTTRAVAWRVELLTPQGRVADRWYGIEKISGKPVSQKIFWNGKTQSGEVLADGNYQVRLTAVTVDAAGVPVMSGVAMNQFAEKTLNALRKDAEVQSWPMQIGKVAAPSMPAFAGLPTRASKLAAANAKAKGLVTRSSVAATGSLPYTVYYGNLHSQTNHSDGGGDVSNCTGAQNPQSGTYGPTDAYQFAMNRGLDFLLTSEHNHMYDGSDSTNTSASAATAKNLYQSGLSLASSFNSGHANFLAIYGMEWGVISNGGHLNILNANELVGWEYNSSNQLLADTFIAKNDYASLYTLMKQRGWIGQFNHPSTSGQFIVNGTALGYTADGDQAMALCEVMNTSAFSTNTTETETGRSNYEAACKKALEAGYHVAFSTNQDNHCANWGVSYTNRTGVLIPSGLPLNNANFIDAIKARRVFATMDKNSQIVLTANGHVMGERFTNSGALNLNILFANSAGRTAATVEIYEGVPGRNGTVSLLTSSATASITPAIGEHFYYAKITQDDGNMLWSAPIWVTQSNSSADTTAPTVSATESGSSGTITLSANASDNVGVTKVEFYVDGALKGSSTAAPYSLSLNATTLSNGSHTLVAKAYDAAGNVGTSSSVSFSVSNVTADTTAPTVTASESGSSGTITLSANATDNVGVTKVEFYVDGTLKGSSTAAPYSLSLNSTTLSNGSHTLVAKAYDAAGNVGTSSSVSFSVSNTVSTQLITNGSFESGASSWTASSGVISNDSMQAARTGTYKAWMNGYGSAHTDTLYQQVSIPSGISSATLSFWLKVVSDETTTTQAYDTLKVQVQNSSGTVLATLATYSNLNKGSSYLQKTFDLSAYKGQTIRIYFVGVEGSTVATSFLVDDVTLTTN